MLGSFSQYAQDAVYPYGSGGPNGSFAFLTNYYMREYGATREDFGKLCVAQRTNALANPNALFKKPLTLDEYLDARLIAEPLYLFDCVMPCAGGEGFMVMSRENAERKGLPYVNVLSTIERHNAFPYDPIQMRGGWVLDIDELYDVAENTEDIDFLVYLVTTIRSSTSAAKISGSAGKAKALTSFAAMNLPGMATSR